MGLTNIDIRLNSIQKKLSDKDDDPTATLFNYY